jgi:mono/diheme cytochrome c family protein
MAAPGTRRLYLWDYANFSSWARQRSSSAAGPAGSAPARPLLAAPSAAESKVDYNRDVRPILSENCFACHGFDEASREAELRLDVADSATADRGGYAAIVAGDSAASAAWQRIISDDESEVMPPVDSHRKLTAEQKEVLRRWIDEGAAYAKHWAFIPPVKNELPTVSTEGWGKNEIDRFVLARLEREGLKPSGEASRQMVIRRLFLDLTGLPPSADEVESFVADERPDAYEQLVDQLLASPHFGERMALEWLDAARYADTNGFSIDGGRHMWLWRDWVINAFNQNMPYDQFLVEQLAGDLLPNHTDAQLVASGFQRNNMVTHEGGTIPEENLTNYNADRVKTLGEAVFGLTLGCAQCHDHKYDPLTQREYYQLFAYFNTLSDVGLDGNAGVNPRPYFEAKTVLPADEEPTLREQIAKLRKS